MSLQPNLQRLARPKARTALSAPRPPANPQQQLAAEHQAITNRYRTSRAQPPPAQPSARRPHHHRRNGRRRGPCRRRRQRMHRGHRTPSGATPARGKPPAGVREAGRRQRRTPTSPNDWPTSCTQAPRGLGHSARARPRTPKRHRHTVAGAMRRAAVPRDRSGTSSSNRGPAQTARPSARPARASERGPVAKLHRRAAAPQRHAASKLPGGPGSRAAARSSILHRPRHREAG